MTILSAIRSVLQAMQKTLSLTTANNVIIPAKSVLLMGSLVPNVRILLLFSDNLLTTVAVPASMAILMMDSATKFVCLAIILVRRVLTPVQIV